uniref:Uncharacterized protein n=1 Tax=Kalanchoe fedtschenkoi TaxID=63787 RepID=A0A7N0T3P8_KALFE
MKFTAPGDLTRSAAAELHCFQEALLVLHGDPIQSPDHVRFQFAQRFGRRAPLLDRRLELHRLDGGSMTRVAVVVVTEGHHCSSRSHFRVQNMISNLDDGLRKARPLAMGVYSLNRIKRMVF